MERLTNEELFRQIELRDRLLACYRTGCRPSGKVLDGIIPLAELRERRAADIECSRADCDRRATTFDFRGRDVCDEHK